MIVKTVSDIVLLPPPPPLFSKDTLSWSEVTVNTLLQKISMELSIHHRILK